MDTCCATMKANTHPMQISRGFGAGDKGFLREKVKGLLKSRASGTKFCRSLRSSVNRAKQVKPGVDFSVFTQDINQEIMVNCTLLYICILVFQLFVLCNFILLFVCHENLFANCLYSCEYLELFFFYFHIGFSHLNHHYLMRIQR